MEELKNNNTIARDTSLYVPAKAIEGIVGVITLILYTNYFSPSEYGDYSFILTTVNMASLILIGWLMHSVTRYINEFSNNKKLDNFFSTVFITWFAVIFCIITAGVLLLIVIKPKIDTSHFIYYFIALFMFLATTGTQIILSALGAARIIKLNISLSIFSVTTKVILTTIFVKVFSFDIRAALFSILITDTLVMLIAVLRLKLYSFIKKSSFSKNTLKDFSHYGFPLVGFTLTMTLLNFSDRYIVKFMLGSLDLGIYAANYTVASSVFTMIIFAVMKGVYPSLLKMWRENNINDIEPLLSKGVRYYILIAFPAFVGLSFLSGIISKTLLGDKYQEGSNIIILVAAGMLLYGLSEYNNKAWELTSSTGKIFINGLICCLFNIIANLIFVPILGYIAAALSTTLSYLIFFILTYIKSRKILKWSIPAIRIARIILCTIIMGLDIYLVMLFMPPRTMMIIISIISAVIVYFFSLYLTGEIKTEVKQIIHKIKK